MGVRVSLSDVFDHNDDELASNRLGQMTDSQAERLVELLAAASRMIVPNALLTGGLLTLAVATPMIILVALGGLAATTPAAMVCVLAVLLCGYSFAKQREAIGIASQALAAGTVDVTEGPIELERGFSIPEMKRGYVLRVAHPLPPGRPGKWTITTEQGSALVAGTRYRIYHTATVLQSIEPSPVAAANDAQDMEAPPVRWTT